MSRITYKSLAGKTIEAVHLDGRRVGSIRPYGSEFAYKPDGAKRGDCFATVAEVKASIEAG